MRTILITISSILAWLALTILFVNLAGAEEQSTTKQSVLIEGAGGIPTSVTVMNEYDVEMTASVPPYLTKCLQHLPCREERWTMFGGL